MQTPSKRLLIVPVIAVLATIVVAAHWYIADRLLVAPGWPEGVVRAGKVAIWGLGLLLILQPLAERLAPRSVARAISWPAHLWMGLGFYLLMALLASEVLIAVGGATPSTAAAFDPVSGPGLNRGRALAVLSLSGLAAAAALLGGLGGPRLNRLRLELARWSPGQDGFRIVQISDIHIGPILGADFARHIVQRVNALEPDLIVITGDLVDGPVSRLKEEVAPFADLESRHGVYFVTGNHDHYSHAGSWTAYLDSIGIGVLRNDRVLIEDESGAFHLAGVDDHRSSVMGEHEGEDLGRALDGVDDERALVLLAHDPATFVQAHEMRVDLQLSGHTHGGQIWPFHHFVRIATPFVAGLHRRGHAQLYVSRGTGFWGPPMRLLAPAEITEITVEHAASTD